MIEDIIKTEINKAGITDPEAYKQILEAVIFEIPFQVQDWKDNLRRAFGLLKVGWFCKNSLGEIIEIRTVNQSRANVYNQTLGEYQNISPYSKLIIIDRGEEEDGSESLEIVRDKDTSREDDEVDSEKLSAEELSRIRKLFGG